MKVIQLDEQFLEEVGLGRLRPSKKQEFLEYVYKLLEETVGELLTQGMSSAQLEEFDGLIDKDAEKVSGWLQQHRPNFKTDPDYLATCTSLGVEEDDLKAQAEYASSQWFEMNAPHYRKVVATAMSAIKEEIKENHAKIFLQILRGK